MHEVPCLSLAESQLLLQGTIGFYDFHIHSSSPPDLLQCPVFGNLSSGLFLLILRSAGTNSQQPQFNTPGVVGDMAFCFACTYFASIRCTWTWFSCVCNLMFLSRSCSTKRCSCCIAQSCGSFSKRALRPATLHTVCRRRRKRLAHIAKVIANPEWPRWVAQLWLPASSADSCLLPFAQHSVKV